MKIGIFGGSFDPVHYGHLILAEQCREQAGLDRVIFVPATVSPLKTDGPAASDKHRLQMLSLAIAGHTDFEISTCEIDRGGKSYTVDTLNEFKTLYENDELYFLMGQDSVATFCKWKSPAEILQLASPLVVRRPRAVNDGEGIAADLEGLKEFMDTEAWQKATDQTIQSRLIDISSTDIRNRVGEGQSIKYLVPRAVEKYIETNKLYQNSGKQ